MKRFTQVFSLFIVSLAFLPIFPSVSHAGTFTPDTDPNAIIYCNNPAECGIDKGIDIVKNNVDDIEKNKKFSDYVQDIMKYALTFVAIIGVIIIIFAGFQILTAGGDDKKVSGAKTMIMYAAIGMLVMFLAWSIVKFVINVTGAKDVTGFQWPSIVTETMAYGSYDTNTFDEYKQKIETLTSQLESDYKLSGKLSASSLSDLQRFTALAIDTFAQDDNLNTNTNLGKNLLISIEYVRKNPGSDNAITDLAKNLNDFLNKTKVNRITGKITVTPQTGNAPLAVTFRAENVIDPSGVTVPKTNFIWSIRGANNTRTVIGTGPSVMYKFQDERNYTVNLDIVSASRNGKGKIDILPYTGKTVINVLPRAGTVYMYINGVSVTSLDRLKITPAIGRAGVLIDASASLPANGSQFTKTSWDFGNGQTKSYDGAPKVERQVYSNEGTYRIRLKLLTNENKEVIKDLQLDAINPIATIQATKLSGFSKEDFKFQASTFFAGGQLRYEWNITDLAAERVIYSQNSANITFKFPRSGKYAVKLKTSDAAGREDMDTAIVTIESRDPVASFKSVVSSPELPNTYSLDATTSYDPDAMDASGLNFDWTIDGQRIELENSSRNGAVGKYTFNTIGTHNVTLDVTNADGKISSDKRAIIVDSLLSVRLRIVQRIVQIANPVTLIAESPEAKTFEWNFGDGTTDVTSDGRTSHIFKKSGTYAVTITVRGADTRSSNSVIRNVYVTDSDQPFALIDISTNNEGIELTPDACNGESAYVLDRANIVTFSAADSLNVDGSTTGLTYTWKYTSKNSNQKTFTYKFDELGCFPVDLTVRSQKNGKVSSMRSYIKIENIPPKMSGLTILPNDLKADPVIVKVSANNARDEDGVIVSYLWYYYTDTDPEPQDFRISRLPSTTFVLPKISGKYFFAVSIEDSNGAKINSEEISEERYSLTLASDNINTPIITLKTSNTAIFVGESTSFSVATKNILGTDISDKCEYKWDFDGDGFYDETTTAPKTTHVYNSPGTFSFKVKATYKGMSNTKYQQIIVRNELKPQFDYVAVGDKLMLFNTTKGFYTQATWDLGGGISSTNLDAFSYDFTDSTFPSSVTLTVSDGDKATQAVSLPVRKDIVNKLRVEKKEGQLVYFTYPKAENDTVHLATPDQKLFVYLGESKGNIKKYAIDTNVDIDSDLDGIKDNDADNAGTDSERKGLTFAIKSWDSKTKQRTVRLALYGEGNKLIESKDLQVILDFANESSTSSGALDVKKNANIADEDKIVIEEIKNEITPLASSIRPKMMDYLAQLQDSWNDEREKTKTIIDFEAYIEQNLSAQKPLQEKLFSQLESLLVSQKNNKDKISIAAQVLKNLAKPSASYDIIVKKMDEILSHPNDIVKNKSLGQEILKMIETDTNIPSEDKVIIKSQLQEIIYSGAPAGTQVPVVTQSSGGSSGIFDIVMGFVKILGYVLLGLVGLLLVIFVYYKISKKNENLSFQDFLIEKFLGGTSETITSTSGPTPAPQKAPDLSRPEVKESPAPAPVIEQMAPEAPVPIAPIQEDIAQSEAVTATDTSTDNQDVPDWLKNSSSTYVAPEVTNAPTVEATVEQSAPPASDIPDWLKGGEMFATPTPESSKNDDIPDWLKGMNTEEINAEVEETLAPVTPVVGTPQSNSFAEIAAEPTTQSTISNDDDIPEWLKQNSDESSQPVAEAGIESVTTEDEQQEEETTPFEIEEVGAEPKKGAKKPAKKPAPKAKKVESTPKLIPDIQATNNDDLPEWLK